MSIKAKPILFSGPMVRAILEGRKTQTRRIIKKAVGPSLSVDLEGAAAKLSWLYGDGPGYDVHERTLSIPCPHPVGSEMWVRETWGLQAIGDETDWHAGSVRFETAEMLSAWVVSYRADFGTNQESCFWRTSVLMPRWAYRLTLTVTDVRVERLQDISEEDAKAEGLKCLSKDGGQTWKFGIPDADGEPGNDDHGWHWHRWSTSPVEAYRSLWESINGPGSWDANPYVWAYTFEILRVSA